VAFLSHPGDHPSFLFLLTHSAFPIWFTIWQLPLTAPLTVASGCFQHMKVKYWDEKYIKSHFNFKPWQAFFLKNFFFVQAYQPSAIPFSPTLPLAFDKNVLTWMLCSAWCTERGEGRTGNRALFHPCCCLHGWQCCHFYPGTTLSLGCILHWMKHQGCKGHP